ncbi:MAG: hypothetical protein ACYCQJ_14110 [Nitrososphaerales archaeon]
MAFNKTLYLTVLAVLFILTLVFLTKGGPIPEFGAKVVGWLIFTDPFFFGGALVFLSLLVLPLAV